MDKLVIEKTNSTPYVKFDAVSGVLEMKGESFPENVAKFYTPVLNWLKEYLETAALETTMIFEIIYFNSSSSKIFMTIFDLLDEEVGRGKNIKVIWRCDSENETAIECGEEFRDDVCQLPFEIEIL